MRNLQIVHGLAQALGRLTRLGQIGVLQDDDEFLAAVADHEIVLGAHGIAKCLGNLLQAAIAFGVSAMIVEQLEVIDVDHQHALPKRGNDRDRRLLHELVEVTAIEGAGQGIGVG